MAALWSVLQTLMIMLGLIFAIVSFATESWSQVSFDMVNPSSVCPKGAFCFVVPLSVPSNEQYDFTTAVQAGIYNATKVTIDMGSLLVESQQLAQFPSGDVQIVAIFLMASAQSSVTLQHVAAKLYAGLLTVQWKAQTYTAVPLPAQKPLHIVIDFGLVNECFQYDFPIPEFSTPLTTRNCFSKTDICDMVDSKEMDSLSAQADARDVQSDISKICKKMTATVALCAFVVVTTTLVALVVVFPTVRRFSCHLASPQLQAGLLAVAFVMSLSAVIVWATVVTDARSMESHFQDQLQKTELGALITAELPQNFASKLSYSFYLQLCTAIFTAIALALTYVGGIRQVQCLARPFPRSSGAAKLEALQAAGINSNDDDEDDDRLINTL